MTTLSDAMEAAANRKEAALGIDRDPDATTVVQGHPEYFRRVFSDFDIDENEARDSAQAVARTLSVVVTLTGNLEQALCGAWVDGLLTGLLLAKMRRDSE